MHERIYQNAVVLAKKFGNAPLTLLNKPVGKDASYGYEASDEDFLSRQWAKETGAYYFDLNDFLEAVHLGNTEKIENYKKQLQDKKKIITSSLILFTNKEQTALGADHWVSLFTELKDIWANPSLDERRIVLPLSLTFGLGQHAAVACLNFKPAQKSVDVIFIEQHAQKKGTPDYNPQIDYTDGLKLHEYWFGSLCKNFVGMETVNTFKNDEAISHRRKVCGVIATEVARQLLATADPMKLAKSGIKISDAEVDTLHARNQELEAKYGPLPLEIIHQNGGKNV